MFLQDSGFKLRVATTTLEREWNLSLKCIVKKGLLWSEERQRVESAERILRFSLNIWTNIRLTTLFVESSGNVYIHFKWKCGMKAERRA